MRTVVVTGGFGMVGSNYVRALLQTTNCKVVIIDNNLRQMRAHFEELTQYFNHLERVNIIEKDVRDVSVEEVQNLVSSKLTFVHLADIVAGIGFVFNNQYEILKENQSIDISAFELANSLNADRVVYASTACVFNQESQRSIDSKISMEKDLLPANPESTYGWAKLFGQLVMQELFKDTKTDVSTVYFHNMVGYPCDFWSNKSQFIPAIINRTLETVERGSGKVGVWGSGHQGRALVPVTKAAEFLSMLSVAESIQSRYHFGPNFCSTVNWVAQNVIEQTNLPLIVEHDLTKPEGDTGRSVSEVDYLIGWEITAEDVSKSISETFKWVKNQRSRESLD
jgi:GDP-D-mannose 3', 5'-epimerase